MIREWALEKIASNALVLDIESTGGSFQDEMIDLAIVDLKNMSVLYDSLFKPTAQINYYAQQVHGIDHHLLRNAPYLENEFSKINSIIQDKQIITYNVAFDKRTFYQSYTKYDLEVVDSTWECLMLKCNKHFKIQQKLGAVCEKFNLEKGTHRALSDALAAARVVHALANL